MVCSNSGRGASPPPEVIEKLTKWLSRYLWHWETCSIGNLEAAELIAGVTARIFSGEPQDTERLLPEPSSLFQPLDNRNENTRQIELYESLIRNQSCRTATGR